MKKEQKSTVSLMKYYQAIIHSIVASDEGIRTRKEIEDYMVYHKICKSRQVTKILDAMVTAKHLDREKILGQKRYGYVIHEEIIGKKNESFVTIGVTKKGNPIRDRMTQTELTREFKEMVKRYRKIIGNKKSDLHKDDLLFYVVHVTLITVSLSWITRLILTVQGGVFGDKINKINLAHKNIEILQEFVNILCINLQNKFPDTYDLALSGMLWFFENLDPFEGEPRYSRKSISASSLLH